MALVGVRYLPARVAIGRFLGGAGWTVIEVVDPDELALQLARCRFQAAFIESGEPSYGEALPAIHQAASSGTPIIGVGSRMRGGGIDALRDLGDIPRVFHPFQDIELEKALGMVPRV
jgi:hypothetical protein